MENPWVPGPFLLDERSPEPFRGVFGRLLSGSSALDTAILRIRLSGVDLSARELEGLRRLRILIADINAQTLEEEAFGLLMDPTKRATFQRVRGLLRSGKLEIRSAPLAGWSPDFSIFSGPDGPRALLMGLHWVQRPFPHRGPAWLACFGPDEARRGQERFRELWKGAHAIGPAILNLLERASSRWRPDQALVEDADGSVEGDPGAEKTQGAEGRTWGFRGPKPVDTPPHLG